MDTESEGGITADDVIDFLEKGLLDNLVSLFKVEPSLYALLPRLLSDERIVVRLGTSALVESLAEEDPGRSGRMVEELVGLLSHVRSNVRGDAAYLLGAVGSKEAIGSLEGASRDGNADVREAVEEALVEIARRSGETR